MELQGMGPKARILIVEDGREIARLISARLRHDDLDVQIEDDGLRGLAAALRDPPDLIILDRMLPGLDGLEICRRIRRTSDTPILMLTAHGEPLDRIEGLNTGANDYLPKPFELEELVARVHVQLRGRHPRPRTRFECADLSLDVENREVWRGGRAIALTPKEFELLRCLIQRQNKIMSREQLLESVWGFDFDGDDNILDVFVRALRLKVEDRDRPKLIHTVRGIGYVLREDPSVAAG